MDLQLSGKVVQILKEQSGEGRNGPWRKRDFILEIPGKFPRKVCIAQWGDNIDQQIVEEGAQITVHIDLQSREYNGNWYTDVKAWRIDHGSAEESNTPPPPSTEGFEIDNQEFNDLDDDLPF